MYGRAGLEKEKSVARVVLVALSDWSKTVLSVAPGYRERVRSWTEVLRDRGLRSPRLVCGGGHLGIWGTIRNACPEVAEQRCSNHKILNVLANLMLRAIPYAETREGAERLRRVFTRWCVERSYRAAGALERDWDRMVALYDFRKEHWRHLRTTKPVESPFSMLLIRTNAARRYKRVDRAMAVIWKMMMAESKFRRLLPPELMPAACRGATGVDEISSEAQAATVSA